MNISQQAREAYANIAKQEAAHAAWKAALKPVPRSAVVTGWERAKQIEEHYEATVKAARAELTEVLMEDNAGDAGKAIEQLIALQNEGAK
jgi:hypothetical protein